MLKNITKSVGILALAVLLISTTFIAGCGSNNATNNVDTTASNNNSGSQTTSEATSQAATEKTAVLKWYVPATTTDFTDAGLNAVLDEVNMKFQSEINATLDLAPINWADYDQRMSLIIASAEAYDMCFTAYWINDFVTNAGKGAFTALDEAFNKYGTTLQQIIPEPIIDCVRINGTLYGIPNNTGSPAPKGPYI